MNWIIGLIILILILSALAGFRRGAIESLIGLAGFIFALLLAFFLYEAFGSAISSAFNMSAGISNFSAFLLILVIFQIIYSLAVVVVFKYVFKIEHKNREIMHLDRCLGFIPGIISGWVFSALLISALLIIPISANSKEQIKNNSFTNAIANSIGFMSEKIENLFVPASNDAQLALQNLNQAYLPETNDLSFTFPQSLELNFDENAENQMLDLINSERKLAGLNILKMNAKLQEVARQHSYEMFKLSYFDHISPVSGSPFDRITDAKIQYVAAGENIAYAPSVNIAHDGLMNSPKHRDNILSKSFSEVGIGIVSAGNWGIMFTQDFMN